MIALGDLTRLYQATTAAQEALDVLAGRLEAVLPETEPLARDAGGERRGMTLRLRPEAWKQLKFAAIEQGVPAHDLLTEALNDWFAKRGKPPIA
jgi:hypothetical protein